MIYLTSFIFFFYLYNIIRNKYINLNLLNEIYNGLRFLINIYIDKNIFYFILIYFLFFIYFFFFYKEYIEIKYPVLIFNKIIIFVIEEVIFLKSKTIKIFVYYSK